MKRILIVDDSPTSRAVLANALRSDYEVHQAADGLEGLARSAVFRPDLILLDVQMPVLDGRGACRALRADMTTQHIPVILVTSLDAEDDVEQGYLAGCNDYIRKPVDKDELLAKVKSWLDAMEFPL